MRDEPVQRRLLLERLLLDNRVRLSRGRLVGGAGRSSVYVADQTWTMTSVRWSEAAEIEPAWVGGKDVPLPVFLPPNPPLPRRTTVPWFSKIFLPVALSIVSTTTVTEAAFPW